MKKVFILEDLCCANCAQKIEDAVLKVEGITSASVAFLTQKLKFEYEDDKEQEILDKVRAIVKKIEPDVTIIEK